MFENGLPKGVEMLLGTLIKGAAPQLAQQVDQIGVVVQNIYAKLAAIEARQNEILAILATEKSHAERPNGHDAGRSVDGAGKSAG